MTTTRMELRPGRSAGVYAPSLAGWLADAEQLEDRCTRDLATAAVIAQLVAYATGVEAQEIVARGRARQDAARARQIAMYLAHTLLSWPLWRVGQAFGRDRTTAGHACSAVEQWRDDRDFDGRLAAIEACLEPLPQAFGALGAGGEA